LRQRLAQEPFKTALRAAWSALNLEDFLAHHIANNQVARALQHIETWPNNTDDRTVIAAALSTFEPYVKWDRKFLELRKACYKATRDSHFQEASRDLDEFLANEPLTADFPLLAKLLQRQAPMEIKGMHLSTNRSQR